MDNNRNRYNLSKREFEVMTKVSIGRLNKEIAEDLNCTHNTVRKHLQNIFPKMRVQNRTEASIKFIEDYGILSS